MRHFPHPCTFHCPHQQFSVAFHRKVNPPTEPTVYTLYPFQRFFLKNSISGTQSQNVYLVNRHASLNVYSIASFNPPTEPIVYTLYPLQRFFLKIGNARTADIASRLCNCPVSDNNFLLTILLTIQLKNGIFKEKDVSL